MNIEQRLQDLEDRIAIRELIDEYTYCADTRDAEGQMAIFTEDTNFEVYMDEKLPTTTQIITGRENLRPVFNDLNQYFSTMHFNGQSGDSDECDHSIPAQADHPFRAKLTRAFRGKLTTPNA